MISPCRSSHNPFLYPLQLIIQKIVPVMSTRTLLLFGVLLCAIALASAGKGKGKWEEMMKKCNDDEINMEEFSKGFKECKKEASGDKPAEADKQDEERRRRRSPKGGGGKWGKKMEKMMCPIVCTLKTQGVLDDSGQFNEAGCKEHVDKVYPEKYRDEIQEKMKKCSEDHSSKFSMDDNCKGYKDFVKCAKEGHKKTCGIEWKKGKGKGKGKPKESDDEAADEE